MKTLKERIITVGHYPWSRAMLLQVILQDSGVDCFLVSKENNPANGYVDIRVKQTDIEMAMKVIRASVKDSGKGKDMAIRRIKSLRRILVPVDFSDISFNACRFAVSLAQKYKAEVKLIHVYYNPAIDVSPYADHYSYQLKLSDSLREIEKSARESMLHLEHRIRLWCIKEKIQRIRISGKLLNGFHADEIIRYSEEYKPAIIVMGTRGLTRDNYKAFGQVTNKVIEGCTQPVLALPSGTIHSVSEIKNIMYATDFDSSDYAVINRLIQIVKPFEIKLFCVHICRVEKKPWDTVMFDELKQHLSGEYQDVKIEFENLVYPDEINGIESFIRENHIDALAVTTHKRNLLEKLFIPSFSKKVFKETGKPLLIFHS